MKKNALLHKKTTFWFLRSTKFSCSLKSEFNKLKTRQKYSEYYQFQKLLGQGAFCRVYQALDLPSGEIIAVKVSPFLFT